MLYYEYAPDPYGTVDLQTLLPAAQCGICQDELYLGQSCYRIEGALICEHCLSAYARAYFRRCRCTLAALPPEERP